MPRQHQIIHIYPEAPHKPHEGAPCNGCGVCCLAEPCPLGVLLSGRRQGACRALRWHEKDKLYRCGAMTEPKAVLHQSLSLWLRPIGAGLSPVLAFLARRWIAAGQGCDSTLQVDFPGGLNAQTGNSPTISPTHTDASAIHADAITTRHD